MCLFIRVSKQFYNPFPLLIMTVKDVEDGRAAIIIKGRTNRKKDCICGFKKPRGPKEKLVFTVKNYDLGDHEFIG